MGLIRLILALSVVACHSTRILGTNFVGGDLAVEAFYVISGFYMSLILNEKYTTQKHSYRLFMSNRFLRLFPSYWIILALTVLFSAWTSAHPYHGGAEKSCFQMFVDYFPNLNFWSFSFLIFTNIFLFFQDVVMFLGLNTSTGNLFFTPDMRTTHPPLHSFLFVPQAWTIGVELSFYLVAPFLVRQNPKIVASVILMTFALKFILYRSGLHYDPWTYRFFPVELSFFLLGNISYAIYRKIQTWQLKPRLLDILLVVVIGTILLYSAVEFPLKKSVFLALFCLSLPFIFYRTRNSKMDSYIGDLSYPVYLSHMLVLAVILWLGWPIRGVTLAILSILFSLALNELVAKRIDRFRQRRVRAAAG